MPDFNLKKRPRLTETLPAAAVTPEMLADVEQVSVKYDISISAVIRTAIEFFLAAYSGKPIEINGETREDETGHE